MKTFVYIGTSLDGFIARQNGDIDWLVQFANDEAIQAYKEFINGIDAIIIGRGTFEKVLSFPTWPYEKDVFVLSTTIKEIPGMLKEKVTVLSMKPRKLITDLSNKGFSSMYVDGGKVIQAFLKEDLVDELIISRAPVILGSGIPLFDSLDHELQFEHIRTRIQSNGLVRSYYKRKRK
jgi:dihydrofolate reductase